MALTALALLIASPVAVWWYAGDQTEVPDELNPDYAVRPMEISPAVENTVGIAAGVTVLVGLLFAAWMTARHRDQRAWWSVILPVLTAGYLVGSGWRVVTAGVIGANIGAGMVFMWGGPAVVCLLIWAIVRGSDLVRR
jgi:hypothetical protein